MFASFPFDPTSPHLLVGRDRQGRFFVAVPAPKVDLASLQPGDQFDIIIVSFGDPLAELLLAPPDMLALEADERGDLRDEPGEDWDEEEWDNGDYFEPYDPDLDGGDGFPASWPRYPCCGYPVQFQLDRDRNSPCPNCGAC